MRRRKTTISIAALTALTLVTGCSSNLVEDKNGNVITMNIGDEVVTIAASDLLDDYLQTTAGVKSYYDAVYEVVVRELFEKPSQATKRNDIYNKAKRDVESTKEKARGNAENGGSYDEELDALLTAEGVEDLKELEEKKAYEHMQVELKDQFFNGGEGSWAPNAWEELVVGERDELGGLILDENGDPTYAGYLNERLPYHVRHILIKVGAGSNAIYDASITKDDAIKLGSAVTSLANRAEYQTFGRLAQQISEDDGSAKEFGDLKIMDAKTQFVNEFKLGVYAFEGIYNQSHDVASKAKLNIPSEAKTFFENLGLVEVPYEAALKLIDVSDVEKDAQGNEVNDGEAKYFPRNVYFNKYFNRHNVAVITPTSVDPNSDNGLANAGYEALPGFTAVDELGGQKVLTDEKGNVILMVRAGSNGGYEGVHFISIERSALVDVEDGVSLEEYYTIKLPGDANYPKDGETNKDTFVNFFRQDTSSYKNRADYVKEQIKGFDPRISDRMFTLLYDQLSVQIHDEDLEQAIFDYIDAQFASSRFNDAYQSTQAWNTYTEYVEQQEVLRDRLVPEACAINFELGGADYNEGGICYYAK